MPGVRDSLALYLKLDRIDGEKILTFGGWSHAAANTDRKRIDASREHRGYRMPGHEAAIRGAVKAERGHLSAVLEMIDEPADDRAEAVAALQAAGLKTNHCGGWSALGCCQFAVSGLRDLMNCRTVILNGVNPGWGRQRGAELVAELSALGVDCSNFLPA